MDELKKVIDSYKQMDTLKDIIKKNNCSVIHPLMGESLLISAQRNIYVNLRKKYIYISQSFPLIDEFFNIVTDLKNLSESGKDTLATISTEIFDIVSRDAASVGIFTLNDNYIYNICMDGQYSQLFDNTLNDNFISEWNRIQEAINQLQMQYDEIDESIISQAYEEAELVFNNQTYRSLLILGIREWIINLADLIMDKIFEEKSLPRVGVITSEDIIKANSIFQNIDLDLEPEEKIKLVHTLFSLNPFDERYYIRCITLFDSYANDFINIARYFGVLTKETAEIIAEEYAKSLAFKSDANYSQCIKSVTTLIEYLKLENESAKRIYEGIDKNLRFNILNFTSKMFVTLIAERSNSKKIEADNNVNSSSAVITLEDISIIEINVREKSEEMELNEAQLLDAYNTIHRYAINSLENYVSLLSDNNKEKIINSRKEVTEFCQQIGLDDCQVTQITQAIDNKAIIFLNNYAHNNLNVMDLGINKCKDLILELSYELGINKNDCESAYGIIEEIALKNLKQFVTDNIGTTEADAINCKNSVCTLANKFGLNPVQTNTVTLIIDKKLSEYDLQYRTVGGIIAETRMDADALNIFEKNLPEFICRQDYLNFIDVIKKSSLGNKTASAYLQKYQQELLKFDEKCRKAARYDYFLKYNNRFWNGDKKDMIISYSILLFCLFIFVVNLIQNIGTDLVASAIIWLIIAICYFVYMITKRPLKHKKEWDELTKNGMYNFEFITSSANYIQQVNNSMRICPNCNSLISYKSKFCEVCGKCISE